MARLSDNHARQQALDPLASFAVAAPAGSGKTGLLTQRVLKLLAHCDHPEEVLCITFTRKAAGEMQARITEAIVAAAHKPEPEDAHERTTWALARAVLERDRICGWQLLKAPNRLRIQTIDGLCRSLTKQLPLASGLGAVPDTLERPEIAYRQAVRDFFKLLERDDPLRVDLHRLLVHLDNNLEAAESLLIDLLLRRDQWLGLLMEARHHTARDYLEGVLDELVTDSLTRIRDQLMPWGSDLILLADFAGHNLQAVNSDSPIVLCQGMTELPPANALQLPLWLALLELLLTKEGWRKRLTKNEGFPTGTNKADKTLLKEKKAQLLCLIENLAEQTELLSALQFIRTLPPASYSDNQWQLLDSLTRLLPLLVAQLKVVFKSLGATDFTEITQAALQALGDEEAPTEIALRLDYRIRHILVDEFQDTATPQLQLLEKLTAGWVDGDGRTLFIVGDGMQSCYGFRDANVGIFLDTRRHGIGDIRLRPLDLTVNFRSQQGVVDWVNQVFRHAFPAEDDISRGAVCYADSEAFHPSLNIDAVSCYACVGDNARQMEADQVLNLIQQTRQQRPDDTIAILVRNRSHLRATLATLANANLNWQATEIDPLASRMAIVDLISLTRALLNPADRIAWLSILRAPWCGLDLYDLHAIANTDLMQSSPRIDDQDYPILWLQIAHWQQIPGLSESGKDSLSRLSAVIGQAWDNRRRKSLRQWIEGIWLDLGGASALIDPNDLDNAKTYFALLERYAEAGQIPDWEAFLNSVNQLYATPRRDADPKLQVMTIHKSKGLEFDTVIIPGLDKQPRQDDKHLLLWQERIARNGDKQLLLSPLSATGDEPDALYQFLRREQALKDQLEATRLLYVGCTRAIKQLFLLAVAKVNTNSEDDSFKPPARQSLLAPIWSQIEPAVQRLESATSPTDSTSNSPQSQEDMFAPRPPTPQELAKTSILRLPEGWQRPVLAEGNSLARFRGREFDDEDNSPTADTLNNRHHRHMGTVLHRALCQITEDGWQRWDSTRIRTQVPFWDIQLRQLGLDGESRQWALARIQRGVENTLADPRGQWLLDSGLSQGASELRLWQAAIDQRNPNTRSSNVREFIVDRTFIDAGERWVVDYKSAEQGPDENIETFLAREAELYRQQLTQYAQLFLRLESRPVRTALFFPLLPHFHEVEYDSST